MTLDNLRNSLLTVCRLLEKHNVQYLIVGGTAVALNGYYRMSMDTAGYPASKPDIDIWYNPTYDNYFNILKIIEELGQDITEFKNEKTPQPRSSFFKLDFDGFTLDFLPSIKATTITFENACKNRQTIKFDDSSVHFMSYSELIEDKKATSRAKDLSDIEELKKLKGDENK